MNSTQDRPPGGGTGWDKDKHLALATWVYSVATLLTTIATLVSLFRH